MSLKVKCTQYLILFNLIAVTFSYGQGPFLLDHAANYGIAPGYYTAPAIAFGDSQCLVVYVAASSVRAVILDLNGTIIGAPYILVSNYSSVNGTTNLPSAAFDGENYFVVWTDKRNGNDNNDVYGARISQNGVVLDTSGIAIATGNYSQNNACVAFDGTNYLVVYTNQVDIVTTVISCKFIDTQGTIISSFALDYLAVDGAAIVYKDPYYYVAWTKGFDAVDIRGTRITTAGTVLDNTTISADTNKQYNIAITAGDFQFFVLWQDQRNGGNDIYGARIDTSGLVIDTSGLAIVANSLEQQRPDVAFDGTNYTAIWTEGVEHGVYGARINQDGILIDTNYVTINPASDLLWNQQEIAFDGNNYMVVWDDNWGYSNTGIFGARVTTGAVLIDTNAFLVSCAAGIQEMPSIASIGGNYLSVWSDTKKGLHNIFGTRINESGIIIDTVPIEITMAAARQYNPAVAPGESLYLVIWEDDYRGGNYVRPDIYGKRVSVGGFILDTADIWITHDTVNAYQYEPVVACGDSIFLVTYIDNRNYSITGYDIYATRVGIGGTIMDADGICLSQATGHQRYPAAAFDGMNFMAIWEDERNGSNNADIYGIRVNQNGDLLDPDSLIICNISGKQRNPAIVCNGQEYFAVWQDQRNSQNAIYGTRINQEGQVQDTSGIFLASVTADTVNPTLTTNATSFYMTWCDSSSGTGWDIFSARISPSGTIIDTIALPLAGTQMGPACAYNDNNQLMTAFAGWTDTIGNHPIATLRIWGIFDPCYAVDDNVQYSQKLFNNRLSVQPNPFRRHLHIAYSTESDKNDIKIQVYDISGRLVRDLPCHTTGDLRSSCLIWDGRDNNNTCVESGIYFIKFASGNSVEIKKIIYIK